MSQEQIKIARQKSLNGQKLERKRVYKKRRQALLTVAAVVIFAAGAMVSNSVAEMVDIFNSYDNYRNVTEQYSTIVADSTRRTDDNQNYWYDTNRIAASLSTIESDQLDVGIYRVYKDMGYNPIGNMNDVIESLRSYVAEVERYQNFEDYLRQKGYVDAEGNIDLDTYEEQMNTYIDALATIQSVEGVQK